MQDWNYFYTSNFEITIEVGCNKFEDEKKLIDYWKDNKYALLSYIGQVFGIVLISTLKPLKLFWTAVLTFLSIPIENM
jgi:hypothetical protein